jgi:hypothetical protein
MRKIVGENSIKFDEEFNNVLIKIGMANYLAHLRIEKKSLLFAFFRPSVRPHFSSLVI